MTTSRRPAAKNTVASKRDQPASSSASGVGRRASPKRRGASSVFSHRPPTKRRSPGTLGESVRRERASPAAERQAARALRAPLQHAERRERVPDPDRVGGAAEHRPEDRAATATPNANPSASPRRSFGVVVETHEERPAHVTVLESPAEPRETERHRAAREREGKARRREKHEPADDRVLGAEARGDDPARDPAERLLRTPRRGGLAPTFENRTRPRSPARAALAR